MEKQTRTTTAISQTKPLYGSFIVIIAISVLSLSVIILQPSIIIANAESSDTNGSGGGIDKEQQMGVCVIGAKSPCNGDGKFS